MSEANVAVNFTASVGDLLSGISDARDALRDLADPMETLGNQYQALGASLSKAHAQTGQAVRDSDEASFQDALTAARDSIAEQVQVQQQGLSEKLAISASDAQQHQFNEQQKVAATIAALNEEYAAQVASLQEAETRDGQSLAGKQRAQAQELDAARQNQMAIADLVRQSVNEQARSYEQLATTISQSFNGQIRGLLQGTESWRTAFKNTLEELLIKFIEWTERSTLQYLAGEAAKTSATVSGVAARTGAEQAGAAASLGAHSASILSSILASAAEAFAGVFGFLAPIMGPLAAGPAASAQATVASMAGEVASADIGMWRAPEDMLTLIHHNELIMPAAEAGQFRQMLSGADSPNSGASVQIRPTTHFHVSAIDGGSVSQWLRGNRSHLMKAIDEAVRHGAGLGLRRLSTR